MDMKIFRKVSIERLSSPEQLDRMITITSVKSWLILTAIVCILIPVIIWSITGSLTTSITTEGVLVRSGGIFDISSTENGQITDIRFQAGDFINRGDIVARLDQSIIVDEITSLSDALKLMKEIEADEKEVMLLNQKIDNLKKKLLSSSVIVSQQEGRVVEVKLRTGDIVTPGSVVLTIVKEGAEIKNLIAVMYVPVESGKKLAPGMEARISPSTVRKEEFGFILGRIVSVSEYPVTVNTASQKLGSRELAEALAGGNVCLEVVADLVVDAGTDSGYRWSTLSGPPNKIDNDTVCTVSVIVERQRPIEMVIPQIKNLLGED